MFTSSPGHPTSLLANRMLGINGRKTPKYWEINFYLQKRAELFTFLKLDLQESEIGGGFIEEENKEEADSKSTSLRQSMVASIEEDTSSFTMNTY